MKVISVNKQNKPSGKWGILIIGYLLLMFLIGVFFLVRDNLLIEWETLTAKIVVPSTSFTYSYIYNGKEYFGKHLGWGSDSEEVNLQFIEKHPAGSQVLIKVNKADPYHSKVVQDPISENFLGLVFTVAGILFNLTLSRSIYRQIKSK